jgi:leader peptidase (prepilin peptidase)/N-methyltransferase
MDFIEVAMNFWVFVFGLVTGSFANVCIHRLPKGESVVFPASRCPSCLGAIAPYDNIPVFSWLFLRGRCRKCKSPISLRYPLIELAVGLIFLGSGIFFGWSLLAVSAAALTTACLVLVATDLADRILPDEITLGMLVVAVVLAGARDLTERPAGVPFRFLDSFVFESLLGAAFGMLLLWLVRIGYQFLRNAEGMGLGDVKMIGMIGAFLGAGGVFVTLFFGSFAGALFGGLLLLFRQMAWGREGRSEGPGSGAVLSSGGTVLAAGRSWREVPGIATEGQSVFDSAPVARPLAALFRLARIRDQHGKKTESGRLILDDGADFFRVLAVRVEKTQEGFRMFLFRVDIPFGVFLAAGAIASLILGRTLLVNLLSHASPPGARLLP